ncbi:hypothetical protein BJ912DRAFT_975426 [Pholiota molesta]|nr:hypothetical protein BJ912DRAFT_975426 [Pholiota molesta]
MPGDHSLARFVISPSPSEDGQLDDHRRLIDIVESKPHPKLWFEDGSLVIQASSTRYRIHRTIVCQHSAIFRDMMALPQPGRVLDNENTFDGYDLSALLEALYNLDYFQELELAIGSGNEDFALRSVSGVLRLSIKYEFWILRKKAIQVLEMLNPTTLDEFQSHHEQMDGLFSIIALSKSCGLSQFLPSALYRIGCLLAPDGSQDYLLINSSKIDVIHKVWCLSGRTRISQIATSEADLSDTKCMEDHTMDASHFPPVQPRNGRTLFNLNNSVGKSARRHRGKCGWLALNFYIEAQLMAWNLLPDYFGFQGKSWDELRQNDAEAMNH